MPSRIIFSFFSSFEQLVEYTTISAHEHHNADVSIKHHHGGIRDIIRKSGVFSQYEQLARGEGR